MPAQRKGIKGRLRYGTRIGMAIAVMGGLSPTGTAQGSNLPTRGLAVAVRRVSLDELTTAHPPGAQFARHKAQRSTSSRQQRHQSIKASLREPRHSTAGRRIKDSIQEPATAAAVRHAPKDRNKARRPTWRIVLTIALLTSAILLIALLAVLGRRRRATPAAEDRAVAYMQVRHGHYWQPPDEPTSEKAVDRASAPGPTTVNTPVMTFTRQPRLRRRWPAK